MFDQLSELISIKPDNFLVSTQNGTNGSFINNYLIYSHLNNTPSSRVILILFDKPYIHYKSIHKKLGQKLDDYIQNKRLIIINEYNSGITNVKLYFEIKQQLLKAQSDTTIQHLILIDDISPLLFLGEPLHNIINLVNYMRIFISNNISLSIFTTVLENDQESKVFYIL